MSNEQALVIERGRTTLVELQKTAKELQVTGVTLQYAGETLAVAKRLATVLDDERKALGEPHYAEYKDINNRYNAVINPCKDIVADIERRIASYNRKKKEEAEAAQREYQRKLEEQRKAQEVAAKKAEEQGEAPPTPPAPVMPPPPPATAPQEKIATSFGTVKVKERWLYQIEDMTKVPLDWLVPDEKKILAAINRKDKDHPVRKIPGLKIFPEE